LFGSSVIDNSKSMKRLGFQSSYTLEDGIEKMVDQFIYTR